MLGLLLVTMRTLINSKVNDGEKHNLHYSDLQSLGVVAVRVQ